MLGSWFSHHKDENSKSANPPPSGAAPVESAATLEELRKFVPFSAMDDSLLQELLPAVVKRQLGAGSELFHFGDRDDRDYFLMEGALDMKAADGRVHQMVAQSDVARQAIARLRPRQYSTRTATPVTLLVIPVEALSSLQQRHAEVHYGVEEVHHAELGPESEELVLLHAFREAVALGSLALPAVPEVIRNVQKLASTGEDSVAISRAIADNLALEHFILQSVNSHLFTGGDPCLHCVTALERMGMPLLQALLPAFLPPLLLAGHKVAEAARPHWHHAMQVAGVACWLAERTQLVEPLHAFVGGLLHNAGMLVLEAFLSTQHALELDEDELQKVQPLLSRDVTAMVLESWQVSAIYREMLPVVYNWRQSSATMKPDLADIVQTARYLVLRRDHAANLPRAEQAAAVGKVMLHEQQLLNDRAVWPDISRMQTRIDRIFAE